MEKSRAKQLVAAVVAIASMALCGCDAQPGSADTPSGRPVPAPDAENAYHQLHDASNVSECGASLSALSDANGRGDVPALRGIARTYRTQVAAWDGLIAKISFPSAAQPVVDSLRANIAHQLQQLDSIAAVTDAPLGNVLATYVFYDNARVTTDVDRLADALGHPPSQALNAADQLELARQTYQHDNALTGMLFTAALAHADLNAAKAANNIEEGALGQYAQALNKISWPVGYDGQVNDLRDKIRALIDYDRRQVDMPDVSQVVPAPPGGSPQGAAESQAQSNLIDALNALNKNNKGDYLPAC